MTSSFVNRTGFSIPSSVTITSSSIRIAEAAVEVDARLDGDDVAGRERVGALGREPRRLVDVEAEAVAETVAERAGEVAALDDVARGGVDVDAGHAGTDRVEPRLLRREHDVVRLAHLAVELAGRERARVVGEVAADVGSRCRSRRARPPDHLVAGARVRLRAGRAGADDRLERLARPRLPRGRAA